MSQEQKKPQKYSNQKVEIGSLKFDSKLEGNRYLLLKDRLLSGEISDLILHPRYILQEAFTCSNNKSIRRMTYSADFQYIENSTGKKIIEDTKGFKTEAYKLKKKVFLGQCVGENVIFKEVFVSKEINYVFEETPPRSGGVNIFD